MLTRSMLRYTIDGERIRPIYLTITGGWKYQRLAQDILAIYRRGVGQPRGALQARLAALPVEPVDLPVLRGLTKIAAGYATFAAPAVHDLPTLRQAVFTLAAQHGPCVRAADPGFLQAAGAELAAIAAQHNLQPEALLPQLFADLPERQVLETLACDLTPAQLIARYNTALAQGMLYRAVRIFLELRDGYRTVFKYIKLAGLMHTVRAHGPGYRLWLDGPLSLFTRTERYGLAMARLLPAVLLCHDWRLSAIVRVGEEEKRFDLSPRDGLLSHYPAEPLFDSAPEAALFRRFTRNTHSPWTIAREGAILDLGDTVLIPDFTFTHQDGRVAHLEIVGFWTPDYLRRKFDKLHRLHARNLVIALPINRNCGTEDYAGPVIRFKSRLLLKDVLPALEASAEMPPFANDLLPFGQ